MFVKLFKAFLSRKGLPLVTIVKARLVTVRTIFLASSHSSRHKQRAVIDVEVLSTSITARSSSVFSSKPLKDKIHAFINQLMRQAPVAPAFCSSGHFSGLIPPMAYTGMELLWQMSCKAVRPLPGSPGLHSVAYTCP